ncbi:hypothetical protein F66182_183 [Fusarium sp. NRRL 66182]|nr:hypothetical protein F66182_183 [Fusarium sp. NRRL 66182]
MEPETRATSSFEKDAHKTKDNATKGKARSSSLLTISSGFTFLAALPGDEHYEYHFNHLYVEIYALVQSAFCPGTSSRAPLTSPWLREYPEEFIRYVELVAHPDARAGKWERLLRSGEERSNILQAIIFKILDTKIFSRLLFGADSEHDEILQLSDTALIHAEGFRRSSLRSHTTRTWLRGAHGEPARFWEDIDQLCTQTLALLLPVYAYTAEFNNYEPTSIHDLYQSLHDVIAYAGWISVCIRMSPAIISSNWAVPGEPYAMNQVNACQAAYETSKEAARQHQMRLRQRSPDSERMLFTARVKISVTPEIIRHKPLPKAMDAEGVTSYTIMKPHVVYYEGLRLDQDEKRVFMSLPDYIKRLRDRNCVPRYTALAIMLVVLVYLWVSYTTSGQQTWQSVQGWTKSEPVPSPMVVLGGTRVGVIMRPSLSLEKIPLHLCSSFLSSASPSAFQWRKVSLTELIDGPTRLITMGSVFPDRQAMAFASTRLFSSFWVSVGDVTLEDLCTLIIERYCVSVSGLIFGLTMTILYPETRSATP